MTKNNEYSDANITYLEPREHVRFRPGMYMGGTDIRALHHLIDEVVDNPIESALVGKCDSITIKLQSDNQVTIADNDAYFSSAIAREPKRGKTDRYTLDMYMTEIGMCGCGASSDEPNFYPVGGGLHGVGLSAVNPLTAKMTVTVCHEGEVWKRTYREGVPVGEMQHYRPEEAPPTGMIYTFQPDFTIMDKVEFEFDRLAERCWDAVYNVPNLTVHLIDERIEPHRRETLSAPDGLKTLVEKLNVDKNPLHDVIHVVHRTQADVSDYYKNQEMVIEFALQYTDSDEAVAHSFVNTIHTPDGGTHHDGLRSALQSRINEFFHCDLNWEKVSQGLTLAISVRYPDPMFESQTRVRLLNSDVYGAVAQCAYDSLTRSLLLDVGDHIDSIVGCDEEQD